MSSAVVTNLTKSSIGMLLQPLPHKGSQVKKVSSMTWIWSYTHDFSSNLKIARELIQRVLTQLQKSNWDYRDCFSIELALEEAFANAFHHGNRGNVSKKIHFACFLSKTMLRVVIEDQGEGFDPLAVKDPRVQENRERISGRGVLLIREFMSRVEYTNCGRCVVMEKDCKKKK